jgi:transcriptional regulator with XRE-family HTH domain
MTDAERQRIGRKLRALRIERGLDQIPAAEKAGISVGTLQAIEIPKKHDVKDSNIEKYAQVFGTTVTKLLKADAAALSPTDPRLDDLNDEHLDIARSYMRAKRLPRQAIEVLLSHPATEDALSAILLRLHALPPERVIELNRWQIVAPELFVILEQVAGSGIMLSTR